MARTNVPDIRIAFRYETFLEELSTLFHTAKDFKDLQIDHQTTSCYDNLFSQILINGLACVLFVNEGYSIGVEFCFFRVLLTNLTENEMKSIANMLKDCSWHH